MKKILLGLIASLVFIGCSSDKQVDPNVEPALVVGKSLADFKMNDQHEKSHTVNPDTKQVIFVFTDDMGHVANDYFATKEVSYLSDNKTQFVADISDAPSVIRSMFIMPGLKDYNHTTLLITDKQTAAAYRKNVDFEKIVVVSVEDMKISDIKTITTLEELIQIVEK